MNRITSIIGTYLLFLILSLCVVLNFTLSIAMPATGDPVTVIDETTTIYVATTGSDTTGLGTSGSPYATLEKALNTLKDKMLYAEVTISLAAGTYTWSGTPVYVEHPQGHLLTIEGTSASTAGQASHSNVAADKLSFDIVGVDYTSYYIADSICEISSDSNNDGFYYVTGSSYAGGDTTVTLREPLSVQSADGQVKSLGISRGTRFDLDGAIDTTWLNVRGRIKEIKNLFVFGHYSGQVIRADKADVKFSYCYLTHPNTATDDYLLYAWNSTIDAYYCLFYDGNKGVYLWNTTYVPSGINYYCLSELDARRGSRVVFNFSQYFYDQAYGVLVYNSDFRGTVYIVDERITTADYIHNEYAATGYNFDTPIGIGTTSTDGDLHVLQGSAGTVTAYGQGDIAVFESNDTNGISILTPDANDSSINFGSPSNNIGGRIKWDYTDSTLAVGTAESGAGLAFLSGAWGATLYVASDGKIGIGAGNSSPVGMLDIDSDNLRIQDTFTPASAGASCTKGIITWDTNYVYVCTATNTWKRTALSTW